MTARGLRDNNPGNLRHTPAIKWRGELEPDADGYCRFDTAHNGMRAMMVDLHSKWLRGLNTVAKIIPPYAPPSENPTAVYIADVAKWWGVDPEAVFDLSKPSPLASLASAMMRQEDGAVPYGAGDVMAAALDALGLPLDHVEGEPVPA